MKAVKRWRYYCDHCKKAGMSRYHMANHEASCTLNPARECKLCTFLNGGSAVTMEEMLAVLPDPAQHMRTIPADEWMDERQELDDESIRAAVHAVLPKLREMTQDCPVCILAALRQRRIPVPVVTAFSFTTEMKAAQQAMNDVRAGNEPAYY